MAGEFWRAMSMQHWPDEIRRIAGTSPMRDRAHLKPYAEGATLVETPSFEDLDGHRAAWRALADRAVEPNPFLEPDFALSAALHLPPGQRPEFVLVWQGAGFEPRARLIGVIAVERRGVSALCLGAAACSCTSRQSAPYRRLGRASCRSLGRRARGCRAVAGTHRHKRRH